MWGATAHFGNDKTELPPTPQKALNTPWSKEGHPCLTFLLFKHLAIFPKVYSFESRDLETARLLSSQSMGRHEREGKEVIIRVEKKIFNDGEHSKPTPGNSI